MMHPPFRLFAISESLWRKYGRTWEPCPLAGWLIRIGQVTHIRATQEAYPPHMVSLYAKLGNLAALSARHVPYTEVPERIGPEQLSSGPIRSYQELSTSEGSNR